MIIMIIGRFYVTADSVENCVSQAIACGHIQTEEDINTGDKPIQFFDLGKELNVSIETKIVYEISPLS